MSIFRQKADQLPITIFALFFILDSLIYFNINNPLFVIAWFFIGIWPKGNICAWNHHHQHYSTFRSTLVNRILEIVFAFQTGVTTKAWFLHHVLGHHKNYLDQELDESRWMNKDGTTKSEIGYSFEVALTSFYRIVKVGLNHPKHLRDYLIMMGVQIVLLGLLFWHNWFNALFIFFLPMVVGLLLTSWATFDHHSNLDTKNEFEGSRNVLDPLYNIMTGNLGYHTAHHVKHGVHWSKLPEFHATIEHFIPEKCYLQAGFPYTWISNTVKVSSYILKPFARA
jgi:fatty acid desaturase